MQNRRHAPDDLVAGKGREHENVERDKAGEYGREFHESSLELSDRMSGRNVQERKKDNAKSSGSLLNFCALLRPIPFDLSLPQPFSLLRS